MHCVCVVFTSMLVETQHNTRIDLDPILVFPCAVFLRLVVKKLLNNKFVFREYAMQGFASLCEPALNKDVNQVRYFMKKDGVQLYCRGPPVWVPGSSLRVGLGTRLTYVLAR